MKYTDHSSTFTHEVKQSKFIAHFVPYSLYESTLETLKEQHPKARHFVTAFRYLNEFDQVVEGSSDDGEPKGTSGKPSLIVLQGQEIINTAVIIVRYFGGTKLGTGGLVRAYGEAVNLVIKDVAFSEYKKKKTVQIEMEYSDVRLIEYECEAMNVEVVEKLFEAKPMYTLRAADEDMRLFLEKVQRVVSLY